uniref:NADH-ubiquinone oxidoreductase chain 6 n=1 Tax=Prasinococcus sp. CCMP1194 TaxID=110672 RepID=A0A650AKK9_9VIRI|nr:NADH dehydrogenase subunit 6 [Prasinococcus sp. CCMP1194]|eukprot:scaffold5782_cov618-Prasinococcus_capsulatus_cf.AAC.24
MNKQEKEPFLFTRREGMKCPLLFPISLHSLWPSMTFAFFLLSSSALLSALLVIQARNPVVSVLSLIATFCQASALLLSVHMDFFGVMFLIVYVGAIAVLFLFVVMMLNINTAEIQENQLRYLPIGGALVFLFFLQVLYSQGLDFVPYLPVDQTFETTNTLPSGSKTESVFLASAFSGEVEKIEGWKSLTNLWATCPDPSPLRPSFRQWDESFGTLSIIRALGLSLYTHHIAFFLFGGVILLIAMIGAIALTLHRGGLVRRQDVFLQNTRDFQLTYRKARS